MKKMKIVFIILIILIVLCGLLALLASKIIKGTKDYFNNSKKELFLEDIDFSEGEYALYIRHQNFGEFMVTDEAALKKNVTSLKVKSSLLNYLPGEGDRSYGVTLFKDGKIVGGRYGAIFKIFEIGSLKEYSVPVKKYKISAVKKEIQNKLDSLKLKKNIYITLQPKLPEENKEFHFHIYFPTIAVPVTREIDESGYERIKTINGIDYNSWESGNDNGFKQNFKTQIKNCIQQKAGDITDFDISISYGTLGDGYIYEVNSYSGELRNADNRMLHLKDFMYYKYYAYIGASKEDAEKLLALDYNTCISEDDRNRAQVLAKMKSLIAESTKPYLSVEKGEVGLSDYRDIVTKSKELYVQEYQLSWLEIQD